MANPSEVIDLLVDPAIQKEMIRINPTFNRAELVAAILEAWGGQDDFARDIYREFTSAAEGSPTRKDIMKFVTVLISEESKNERSREVEDMTEEELNKAILSIATGLKGAAGGK